MSKTRTYYTLAQKEYALTEAAVLGVCPAAKKLNIPISAVWRWRAEQRKGILRATTGVRPEPSAAIPATNDLVPPRRHKGRGYTPEYRAYVVARIKGGEDLHSVAAELKVNPSSIYAWLKAHTSQSLRLSRATRETSHAAANGHAPASAPANVVHFCPHCGCPLDAIMKAGALLASHQRA
jgi:hypothetical protein